MFNKIIASISSVCSYIPLPWYRSSQEINDNGKRTRSIAQAEDVPPVPFKRIKLSQTIPILIEVNKPIGNINSESSNIETIDLTQKTGRPHSAKVHQSMKENLATSPLESYADDLSPSKFKNRYKAPRHIRSPNKIKGRFIPSSTPRVTEPIDLTSSDSTALETRRSSFFKRMGARYEETQARVASQKLHENLTREQYSQLLGSLVGDTSRLSLTQNNSTLRNGTVKKPMVSIDLTVCNRTTASVNHVITINDDDNDLEIIRTPRVPPINSFEEKLKQKSINYAENMVKKYYQTKEEFEVVRQIYEKKCHECSLVSREQVNNFLEKRLREHMKITEVVVDTPPEERQLPEITAEMQEKIDKAFIPKPPNQIMVSKFNYNITRKDLICLDKLSWLNDEVINFYMELIMERGKDPKYPAVYTCNTFFYPKLSKNGHAGVKRWTRKVDVFTNDLILVPIHLQVHWCMACIDLKAKTITFYDSMGSSNMQCLKRLKEYLESEHLEKKGSPLDMKDWSLVNAENIPQQKNGSDCGVFACTFAEFLARGAKFHFKQKDMPYFRRKMAYEIMEGRLLI